MEREALRSCHFHKYSALGNDYLTLDPHADLPPLTPERIRAICDRHNGVGADGVVVGPTFDAAGQMRVRIYNPDGSEAEKSGNGLRIFARYVFEAGYVSSAPFTIATRGGVVTARVLDDAGALIEVDMGKPSFRSGDLPMTGPDREVVDEPLTVGGETLRVTCVSMGNPHCVLFAEEWNAERVHQLGPLVERATCFPNRTNVQFAHLLSQRALTIQIWERGAGYTLASGSSSCAAASAARRLGLAGDRVEVQSPGGVLAVAGVAHGYLHADLLR